MEKTKFEGVYFDWKDKSKRYYTKGNDSFFGEKIKEGYRVVDIRRSKLFAAIAKGINKIFLEKKDKVLYLGASHGYTPSFVSDIVTEGYVFCVDFSPTVVRDLVGVCERRKNMIPILGDAKKPEEYKNKIVEVDVLYQDIAQKNQVDILFKNLIFLKKNGYVLFVVKARSIDFMKKPGNIFKDVENQLKEKLKVIEYKILDPYEKDHCFFVCQKK